MLKWKSNCVQLVIGPKCKRTKIGAIKRGKEFPTARPDLQRRKRGGKMATLGHNFHPLDLDKMRDGKVANNGQRRRSDSRTRPIQGGHTQS